MAFLGGSETFGRCIADPFPSRLERSTGISCVNLGVPNAGIDAFVRDVEVPHLLAGARLAVVQVLGAANMSNRFYRVHPRRNDRFLTASSALAAVYDEVDFTDFTFTRHMLQALHSVDPDRFCIVVDELQMAWTARMRTLLAFLKKPAVLLWIRVPAQDKFAADPLMVTRDMIDDISDLVCEVIEVDVERASATGEVQSLMLGSSDLAAAEHLIGPAAHAEIAGRLAPFIG